MPVDNYGENTPPVANSSELRLPYSPRQRAGYGVLWAMWTLVLTVAGFSLLGQGAVAAGLIALVLAAIAGRYDWRIWSWRARKLLFLIIF